MSSLIVQLTQQRPMRRRPRTADFEEETDHAEDLHRSRKLSLDRDLDGDVDHIQGFTMKEAKDHATAKASEAKERTPQEVLQGLQKGNTRFWMGIPSKHAGTAFQRRALISMQYPSVAILSCADSRVPTEIVFDQGLGDLFVVRVAGNALDTLTLASLQYAVNHLKVKVLVVMGHEACGAIKAAGLPTAKIDQEPAALSTALKGLKKGLDQSRLEQINDDRSRDREAVVTNVRAQIQGLADNKSIMAAVRRKELVVVGAFYEISSGIVDFFLEITEVPAGKTAAPGPEPDAVQRKVSRSNFCVPSDKLDEIMGDKARSDETSPTAQLE